MQNSASVLRPLWDGTVMSCTPCLAGVAVAALIFALVILAAALEGRR